MRLAHVSCSKVKKLRLLHKNNRKPQQDIQSIILELKTWMFSTYFIKGLPPFKLFAVNTLRCFWGVGMNVALVFSLWELKL